MTEAQKNNRFFAIAIIAVLLLCLIGIANAESLTSREWKHKHQQTPPAPTAETVNQAQTL